MFEGSSTRTDFGNPETREATTFDGASLLSTYSLCLGVLITGGLVWFAWKNSYFFGDDYYTFYGARTLRLRDFLLLANGSQVVPLQRAAMSLTLRAAPMNFAAALLVLAGFHVLGIVYLYKTLQLIAPTRFNAVLVAWYGSYVFVGVNFLWFSSGIARFPYIAFALIAIYEYLSHCRTGERWRLALVGASCLAALGFYSKGVLVPFYCVGLAIASRSRTSRTAEGRGVLKWLLMAALSGASLGYAVWLRRVDVGARIVNTNISFQVAFVRDAWRVFATSLSGRVLLAGRGGGLFAAAPWLAFVAYSVWRVPRSLLTWSIGALLITLNFLIVGLSSRTIAFGHVMAFEYRHYFEVCFPLLVCVGIVLRDLRDLRDEVPELRWLATSWRPCAVRYLLGVFLLSHALAGYRSGVEVAERGYGGARETRRYMTTLRTDLERLHITRSTNATFADGRLPVYLAAFATPRLAQLFAVMNLDVRVVNGRKAGYRVQPSGDIVQIRR